jgi:gluconate 2-dehydrogenase gamma chain
LIPSDSVGPGAREANVVRYIDRALAGELLAFRPAYTAGLASIDAYADFRHGRTFTQLSTEQQDQILKDLEGNALNKTQDPTVTRPAGSATPSTPEFTPNARSVFEMIRTHALQGMFGDPAHGGNTNMVGWRLVRFPGPRLVISAQDQKINVTPKAKMQSTYAYPLFKGSIIPGRNK